MGPVGNTMPHMQHEIGPKSNRIPALCIQARNASTDSALSVLSQSIFSQTSSGSLLLQQMAHCRPPSGAGLTTPRAVSRPWLSDPIHLPFEIPCLTQRYEHKQPKQIQPPPADQICPHSISPHDLLCAGC